MKEITIPNDTEPNKPTSIRVLGPGWNGNVGLNLQQDATTWHLDLTPGQAWEFGRRLVAASESAITEQHAPREAHR